jgi:SEC-C motif
MTLAIQEDYRTAFERMKSGQFYNAWCALADVETQFCHLERHSDLSDFQLQFIKIHATRFQSLYPYRKIFSIGAIARERRCGICDTVISPRRSCQHRLGEIYDGVMCHHEITDFEGTEVSLVTDPIIKACVMFPVDVTTGKQVDYEYPLVEYVAKCLNSPYHAWGCRWRKQRHPHEHFQDIPPSSPCPCDSGINYELCCLRESGVLRPHYDFIFAVPPVWMPRLQYAQTPQMTL